jgi:hypothetical protein
MQLEQKMEAMLRQVEQLVESQKEMNEKTEASAKEHLPPLSGPEDELRSDLEALKKETEELRTAAEEASMEDSPEFQKFAEAVEKTDADQNMQNMSQALSGQQKPQAQQQGQQALSKLTEMLDQMQQQLLAMKGGNEDAIQKAMRMVIDDANYLSQKQEDLLMQAAALNPRSVVLREMASKQQDLAASCGGCHRKHGNGC